MSDTSGQDSSSGGNGNNGIFSNPTFQKLLQKTIGLVAQLHGGQDPNAQGQAGAPQGGPAAALTPQQGAGAPPQGGPAAALQQAPQPGMPQGPQQGPTSHNGMTLDQAPWAQRNQLPPQGGGSGGGQGSAPPSGATGQILGAPQMPQQGYGGQGQPAAPPVRGGGQIVGPGGNSGGGGNFAQAPWQAAPIQDWGAFNKANPMPKPPSYEDAEWVAEKMMNQKGFAPVGSNTNSLDYTPMIPGILDKMNAQYKEQMAAHTSAFTGQIAGAHAHNQAMAEAERARHDKATEVQGGQRIGDTEAKNAQTQSNKDRAFNGMSAAQQERANEANRKQDELVERVTSAKTAKERGDAAKALAEHYKQQLQWVTTQSFAAQAAGDTAAEQKASDAAGALGPPPGGAGDKQYPTPDASHIKMLKDGTGTPAQFEEAFGPGSAAKYK